MARIRIALSALLLLSGCGFDEAQERAACEKSHPSDRNSADQCFKNAKAEFDRSN
jgi:hypothetical protein